MSPAGSDVRMRGFAERIQPEEAKALLRPLVAEGACESVALAAALGRTLSAEIVSALDVPAFRKSAMDGYGLRAADTFGASPASPVELRLVGEAYPGRPFPGAVSTGECVKVMTGAPVPDDFDAVAMVEVAIERQGRVSLSEALPPGKHVMAVGEDIRTGDTVLGKGRILRPQDLGVLASLGRTAVSVQSRPRVAVATTGNELVPPTPGVALPPWSVVNSNSFVIEALVRDLGGDPIVLPIVPDDPAAIKELVLSFPGDLLVTTGGTAVGAEDYLPVVVREHGEMMVHGISVRPGGPSGFGRVGGRLVFLLPGNPVAAMVGFDLLVRPCLQWMLGQEEGRRNPRARGRLTRKVASAVNRVDFVRVRLGASGEVEPLRSGGAGVLSSMTRAHGFVIVPKDLEGYEAGAEVEVLLL